MKSGIFVDSMRDNGEGQDNLIVSHGRDVRPRCSLGFVTIVLEMIYVENLSIMGKHIVW